jgi:hypothetical protein
MMTSVDPIVIRALFAAKQYPDLSKAGRLEHHLAQLDFSGVSGVSRGIYIEGSHTEVLAFYDLNTAVGGRMHLLGKFDANCRMPFTGLAHIRYGLKEYYVSVADKSLTSGVFDSHFVLDGAKGTMILYRPDGSKGWEWHNVIFNVNGTIQAGSTGSRTQYFADGRKLEYQSVTFDAQGHIQAGSTGSKILYHPDGSKECEWHNVTFNVNGSIQAGSTGSRIQYFADGRKLEYQNVTFDAQGRAQAGNTQADVVSDAQGSANKRTVEHDASDESQKKKVREN